MAGRLADLDKLASAFLASMGRSSSGGGGSQGGRGGGSRGGGGGGGSSGSVGVAADGALLDEVGDPLLSVSSLSTMPASDIVEQAEALALTKTGDEADHAAYYVKAMRRCLSRGDGWAATERRRLTAMIDNGAVRPQKKTVFMIRRNILSALLTNYG